MTGPIHAALAERALLPSTHIADAGYVNAELLVDAHQYYGVELVGPTRGDSHWQVKQGRGFAARDFVVDFEQKQVTCPVGQTSNSWKTASTHSGKPVIKVKFASKVCRRCPVLAQCTDSTPPRRTISIRPQAEYEALREGRAREKTLDYAAEYARSAGVEATSAPAVRVACSAAHPLLRPAQDASGAFDGRHSNERRQVAALAGRRAQGTYPALSLREALRRRRLTDHKEFATNIQLRRGGAAVFSQPITPEKWWIDCAADGTCSAQLLGVLPNKRSIPLRTRGDTSLKIRKATGQATT